MTLDPAALAEGLIEAADEARFHHPRRAIDRAESARLFVASLEAEELSAGTGRTEEYGRQKWIGLQSDAWSVLASAHRGVGDLEAAESELLVALTFLDTLPPPTDPAHSTDPRPESGPPLGSSETLLRRARLAQRAGYIRLDQGRFGEALELLAESRLLYLELGRGQRAASVQVDVALVLARSGRRREAIAQLGLALEVLDREAEPRSYLAAVHNMARALLQIAADAEEEKEAIRWLELARREHKHLPERLHMLRLEALAALTAARFDRIDGALGRLAELAAAFSSIGAVGDQVLALLHAAEISLRHDKAGGRRILGRLFPLMRRLPVDEEAKAALLRLLAMATAAPGKTAVSSPAGQEELTVENVRHAAELVEQSLGF